jgi:hypothetical protein
MGLERYYSGDAAFERFASISDHDLDSRLAASANKRELYNLCLEDPLLPRVIYRCLGERSVEWMSSRPPILDGASPTECLQSDWGRKRLREALLRFPF